MEKRQDIKSKVIMGIIAAISVIMALFPIQALGLDDTDNDGLLDSEEQGPLVVGSGSDKFTYYICVSPPPDRTKCLDPATQDLFVVLTRASNSVITLYSITDLEAFRFISKPKSSPDYGLGITIHPTLVTQITATQKSVRIREDTINDSLMILGDTPTVQNPNLASGSYVYTQRILNYIALKCSTAPTYCVDYYSQLDYKKSNQQSDFRKMYIKHTLAHEAAHNLNLAPYNSQLGSNHYNSNYTRYIMNVSTYTKTDKKGNVTWYIGDQFTQADQSSAALK